MALKEGLKKYFESIWAFVVVSVLVLLGWQFNLSLYVVCILSVYCFTACMVCDELTPILFPVICVPYMINSIVGLTTWIVYGIAVGLFFIGIFIFVLMHSNRQTRKGRMFWFIILADFAFLIGGIFTHFNILNFLMILGTSLIVLFIYWLCINFTGNITRFLAKSFLFLSLIIIAEMWLSYIALGDIATAFSQKLVRIGLSEINTASIYLSLGLMATLYLGCMKKRDYLYLFLSLFILANLVFTFSRAGLLVGGIVFVFGVIYFILKSPNKKLLLTIASSLVLVALIFTAVFFDKIATTLSWYLEKGFSGNGREYLWTWCIEKFKQYPFMGVGFTTSEMVSFTGFNLINPTTNIIYAHNTVIQILTVSGILGLLISIPTYIQKYRLLFTNFTVYKYFALLQVVAIELSGMLDSSASTHIVLIVTTWIIVCSTENETENHKFQHVTDTAETRLLYNLIKRVGDVTICLGVFIVFLPIFLILFILTAIFVGVPIFFVQPRPGKDGKIFNLIKFRSMTNKKDAEGNLLPDGQRITWWGKFLRKTSLDELPQIFNIIKGDMSLIGPRPRLVADMVFYDENVKGLSIRPGLTGLAQVKGRNLNTWEQTFEYDNEYVRDVGFGMDFKIFFKTFVVLLNRQGTSSDGEMPRDYRYGDYLLRVGKITKKEYDAGQEKAKQLIAEFKDKKKNKKEKNDVQK